MLIVCIEGANLRLLGDPEQGIIDVHARTEVVNNYRETTVAFEPTPDELRRLNEGQPVYVTQLGNEFNPIRVEVKK